MPAKRPPTKSSRRDDDGPSRRGGKGPKKGKRVPTYDTYDEAMDGGVEAEEKGERFRVGEKSKRFYLQSLELYQKASALSLTYDSLYNQARVFYILSTSHDFPPESITGLRKSIQLYERAIGLAGDENIKADAGYNLAVAEMELAEFLEEEGGTGSGSGTGEEARRLRVHARGVLVDVAGAQERHIASAGGIPAFGSSAAGMDFGEENAEAGPSSASVVAAASNPASSNREDEDEDEATAAYEEHLPTPTALLETLLLIVDIDNSLISNLTPSSALQEVVQDAWALLSKSREIEKAVSISNGVDASLAEEELAVQTMLKEVEVRQALHVVGARIVEVDGQAGLQPISPEDQAEELGTVLNRLKRVEYSPVFDNLDAETKLSFWNITSNVESQVATIYWTKLNQGGEGEAANNGHRKATWESLGRAYHASNEARAVNVPLLVNPLARPAVMVTLSQIHVRKALMGAAIGGAADSTASLNLHDLLRNAELYANQALTALHWSRFATDTAVSTVASGGTLTIGAGTSLSIGGGSSSRSSPLPEMEGVDHERLARTAVFTLLRALYFPTSPIFGQKLHQITSTASRATSSPSGSDSMAVKAGERGQALLRKMKEWNADAGAGKRKFTGEGVKAFVGELVEDEGVLVPEEREFWAGVEAEFSRA